MKKILIGLGVVVILGLGLYFVFSGRANNNFKGAIDESSEQVVIENTYNISNKYVSLRNQTENVLVNARSFSNYKEWNNEVTKIMKDWQELDKQSALLEKTADKMAEEKVSFNFIKTALAYDKQEISNIFDKAPAGKKIATLAKFLNTDAKKAFKILQQDQNQVTADAWNDAGNKLKDLETSAIVLKDVCKVTVTIGTVIATGGTAAVASASTLTQSAVLVSGADVVLEVSSDAAKITLGDGNKISNIIDTARVVTEPLATILTITSIPENIGTKFEKFGAVMVGLEQFNGAVQEEKILGVEISTNNKSNTKEPVKVAVLEKSELQKWIESNATKTESNSNEIKVQTGEKEINEIGYITGNFNLVMKPKEPTNDWQNVISTKLILNNPIAIKDGKFSAEYSTPLSFKDFIGSGSIRIEGEYNEKTGVIKGTHYLKYEGTYKGNLKKLIYSGLFNQILSSQQENKLRFGGTIETTSLDGIGKPYTITSEGGRDVIYIIKK